MKSRLLEELLVLANPEKAKSFQSFFKTGPGEYGEGDFFWGINVPVLRRLSKKYADLSLVEIQKLLTSQIHEQRQVALFILLQQYQKAEETNREKIVNFYLAHTRWINNWDLVDATAPKILGDFLMKRDKRILFQLARSENLWERRIAIVATLRFVKEGRFEETIKIAEILLSDPHDLIHKAVGWLLREVGKRHRQTEEEFLRRFASLMPRTTLRYALEKFPAEKREMYLKL